ncbi:TetR/AcrR family transcriptional regulator [Nisaea denitrificans]|uniref:TetR/AcrR family transcriptional regulator n=1 Tax=Nisaea denitrificans TaxID=390877 RepID=UPI00056C6EE6|nr:TetR/AcrR family transcriptional regulator [Nisaea denitrificans]
MTKSIALRSSQPRRMSREEKSRETYRLILEAAAQVVGSEGYADASISKITQLAGIAQGTFYNYFKSRQDVLNKLLPYMGRQMLDHIATSLPRDLTGSEREKARLLAFLEYLNTHPAFYRILYEAEVFAPEAHAEHFRVLVNGYKGSLGRAVERGEIQGFDEAELEAVIYMLLSARSYISMHYARDDNGRAKAVPAHVIQAYMKILTRGLFSPS